MSQELRRDWRFFTGVTFFALSWITPFLALFVPSLGLPTTWSAVLAGSLVMGGPEVLAVLAVILLGKENFIYLKNRLFGWIKVQVFPASAPRYYFALTLMVGSSLVQWFGMYYPSVVAIDEVVLVRVRLLLDLIFLSSLVLAGEQFWDKLRRLFTYDAPEVH